MRSSAAFAAILVCVAVDANGARATTPHRLAVSGTTGSEGSQAVLQTTSTGGALQAEVGALPTTTISVPFAGLGIFDPPGGSSAPFGIGLGGISYTGYGVAGEAFGNNPAMIALAKGGGNALEAYSGSEGQYAVYAFSANAGVVSATKDGFAIVGVAQGEDSYNTGIYGETDSPYGTALQGVDISTGSNVDGGTGDGVVGQTVTHGGFGVYGGGYTEYDAGLVGEAEGTNSRSVPGFSAAIIGTSYSIGQDLFEATVDDILATSITAGSANASGTVTNNPSAYGADIANNGDLYLTGTIYTHCAKFPYPTVRDCASGATTQAASDGTMRETYASRHASPTMEDEGASRLQNGFAHVGLDAAFASMISQRDRYMVFVTPQGDNRGLYVTNISRSGFDVRESAGGRSTMDFDYRIVARPYGDSSARLAIAKPALMAIPSASVRARFHQHLARERDAMKRAKFLKLRHDVRDLGLR